MKQKVIYIILIVLIALVAGFVYFKPSKNIAPQNSPAPEVHYHAGFVVFNNGKKVDFSGMQYMNIEPCTVHGEDEEETPEHNQKEKAHLHDNVGDVVHSHVEGAVWGDLFANINYVLDYSKVTAFINGTEVADIKNTPIKAYDSLVIFIGDVNKNLLSQAVTIDHIKQTEIKSETCGN